MCGWCKPPIECAGDGYLWDADGDGWAEGDARMPCPQCNTREFLRYTAEEAEAGGAGFDQLIAWSAASRWRYAMSVALAVNPEVAQAELDDIGIIVTDDFEDADHPNLSRLVTTIVVPPTPDRQEPRDG